MDDQRDPFLLFLCDCMLVLTLVELKLVFVATYVLIFSS